VFLKYTGVTALIVAQEAAAEIKIRSDQAPVNH
jgi:hypothetical protein